MAKLSSDGTYVTVESGDNLYRIASAYGNGKTYQQLASINNISNVNCIYVGQKIYLSKDGSSSSGSGSSTSTTKKKNTNQPTITHFGLLAGDTSGKTIFATWTWSKNKTASYKVLWTYDTGNGVYLGSPSTITVDTDAPEAARQSTFNIPDTAKYIKFKVKPISETETKNDKEVNVWTANWSTEKKFDVTGTVPPEKPSSAITPVIKDYKIILALTGLDSDLTAVEFKIFKDNKALHTKKVSITNGRASYTYTIAAGSAYYVRYRVYRNKLSSEWSDPSNVCTTIPDAPKGIETIRASSEESVYLKWTAVNAANIASSTPEYDSTITYEIQYATKKEHFDDNSDQIQSGPSDITENYCDISGLDSGTEYYFRVRATNDQGSSAWTEVKSVIVGKTPSPPTTWSSTTTAITGEDVILYWVHNSEDNSHQEYAQLLLHIDGEEIFGDDGEPYLFKNEDYENSVVKYTAPTEDELESGKTHSCILKTGQYTIGTKIEWTVQTAGITKVLSEPSTQRTIDVYAPPTLELQVLKREAGDDGSYYLVDTDVITTFPFYIKAVAGPDDGNQAPIGYNLSIISDSIYETTDNIGNPKTVNAGEQVYSKHFDTFEDLLVEFTPGNIDLENNITYTVSCTVSMDSGLTATETIPFSVEWEGSVYEPNAAIGIDSDILTASIRPYCDEYKVVNKKVNYDSTTQEYILTDEDIESVYEESVYVKTGANIFMNPPTEHTVLEGAVTTTGETVYYYITSVGLTYYYCIVGYNFYWVKTAKFDAVTTTGEAVHFGVTADGEEVYYCEVELHTRITDVYLSVYRREYDGNFVEIASGLDGENNTTVTDPHPTLDFARYRIVATSKTTGQVTYYDVPGYPVGEAAVIIQWDEAWTSFETDEETALEQPPWSGSMLRLPYNIDISDNVDPEVEMIEYIGRPNPVSYYGTQRRHTATWNVAIEKSDKETIYALRRLANWLGDVYVREPSGSGYWAHIVVAFDITHRELTIPVTLTITRVEGGI